MGFGGGGSQSAPAPVYVEPEKPQITKPITEATTAARQTQKERAAKAAGIKGSILTTPLQSQSQDKPKTLLGQ